MSDASDKLARNLSAMGLEGLTVVICKSAHEAVKGADIVTTVTADKCNAIILRPEMIEPGMHINAVGGDCPGKTELHADILLRSDARVIVEYEPQSRIEGEIQQLPADFKVAEFADVLNGTAPARATPLEVTIFDSVGFALEDYSALCYLHKLQRADARLHQQIDLIPHLDNPKNLFGLLGPPLAAEKNAHLLAMKIPQNTVTQTLVEMAQ